MDIKPTISSCIICGGTAFGLGPGARTSITGRFLKCEGCWSLERHRIARRVFNRIHPEYTQGKRFLQFSFDASVDPRWFKEMVISTWDPPSHPIPELWRGTIDSESHLDLQAINLADGRYDWIYASHVLNCIPDPARSLREMLRVVGDRGVVVLSVGGTEFNYGTVPSQRMGGLDRLFVLYGTEFADDIQEVLPDVTVLELVATDPSTAALDSLYFYSRSEATLRDMARRVVGDNIHVRVFPPKNAASSASKAWRAPSPLPCNICGSKRMETPGPGGRLTAQRLCPCCSDCGSLERNRIMRRVFDAIRPTYTSGRRLLQFGSELGLPADWFDERLVAPLGEKGRPLATGIEAGRYAWLCSFDLVDETSSGMAALREMLHVAGAAGVVALSLRDSFSKYQPLSGPGPLVAKQRGNAFVESVRQQFPDTAVLELVAVDPCTDGVEAVHFCSRDGAALQTMAKLAEQGDIQVRFFGAAASASDSASPSPSPSPSDSDSVASPLQDKLQRKLAKLRRDPAAFFGDARLQSLRLLKGLFEEKSGSGSRANGSRRGSE